MQLKKNIRVGKIKINYLLTVLIFFLIFSVNTESSVNLEGNFTAIKVLDKISSKNELINLQNGEDYK